MSDLISDVFGRKTESSSSESEEDFGSSQIKIVTAGFGGAGCNIVNRLHKVWSKGH